MATDDDVYDDEFVLVRWLHELATEPNAAVVASLEAVAEERGWHPYDAWRALVAAPGEFSADLHPRGKDGKFIEKFGLVKLMGGVFKDRSGKSHDLTGQRGQVDAILPDPKSPGNPTIRVRLLGPDGNPGPAVDVKPQSVVQAPEKGRLNLSQQTDRMGDLEPGKPAAPAIPKKMKLAAFDPNGDHIAQFTGGNPLSPEGRDDFGAGAARLLSDGELDQVIAMRQQDASTKVGLSPSQDLRVLQNEKDRRSAAAPGGTKKLKAFDPNLDHVSQFEGGNPLGPNGRDDFGRSAAKLLSDGELDQAIAMRQQDVATKRGMSPAVDLQMLQQEKAGREVAKWDDGELDAHLSDPDFQSDYDDQRLVQAAKAEQHRRELRAASEEVKGATDEELARQSTRGPDVWRQAVAQEQANRAKYRSSEDAARQKLMDSVNAAAADLSTTDPEERARGLDDILARLRFSIIDTDKVHDHIYPPGESGRWTPERAAQHEQMWEDLLSQVEAANIPQDHDAFVLGGLPGAGKSFTLRPGQKAAGFGVVAWEPNGPMPDGATHVSVNPDIVKEMMIARGMLPEGISQDLKPMEQVTFLHEESSYIAKMFSQRLGDMGYNVVLDNTMDSEGGMLKRMTPLARQGYKFRGLFVDIPIEESKQSATQRYLDSALTPQGGRFVPSSVQGNRASSQGNMSKNRDAMNSLIDQDWFTEYMIVDNTGIANRTPLGDVTGQGTGGGTAANRYLPSADAAPTAPTAPAAPGGPAPAAAPAV